MQWEEHLLLVAQRKKEKRRRKRKRKMVTVKAKKIRTKLVTKITDYAYLFNHWFDYDFTKPHLG